MKSIDFRYNLTDAHCEGRFGKDRLLGRPQTSELAGQLSLFIHVVLPALLLKFLRDFCNCCTHYDEEKGLTSTADSKRMILSNPHAMGRSMTTMGSPLLPSQSTSVRILAGIVFSRRPSPIAPYIAEL